MNRTSDSETVDPRVPGGISAVRAQLERLCRSGEFASSPRAEEFLRFVVGEALAGHSDKLSQRAIAFGVYGRSDDFDPGIDPVVRMQAKRVRRALEHYYLTVGKHDPIVVRLPKGGYHPEFRPNGDADHVPDHMGGGSPVLMVSPFRNDTGSEDFEFIARGLGAELAVELDAYQSARVVLLSGQPDTGGALAEKTLRSCESRGCFLVEGTLTRGTDSLRVSVRLADGATGILQWSRDGHCQTNGTERDRCLDEFVKQVAASIAEEQGTVAQCVLNGLENSSPEQATAYEALLRMSAAERSGSLDDFAQAILMLRHGVETAPEDGRLWSGLARLCAMNHGLELLPEHFVSMEEVIRYAETGIRLRGADQRAWCILGYAHTIAGNLQIAREATLTALSRNPESLFFRDVIGYLLLLQGDWDRGAALSREAIALNPFVRPAVFSTLWLEAFRREAFDESLAWAWQYMELGIFWAPLMKAVSAACLGDSGGTHESIAQLLQLKPDFRENGRRLIRHFVKREDLACRIEDALQTAGLELSGGR